MNKIKSTVLSVKNHIARHKGAYGFGTVAVLAIVTQQRNRAAFEGFLKEKGIDPLEFYFPEGY